MMKNFECHVKESGLDLSQGQKSHCRVLARIVIRPKLHWEDGWSGRRRGEGGAGGETGGVKVMWSKTGKTWLSWAVPLSSSTTVFTPNPGQTFHSLEPQSNSHCLESRPARQATNSVALPHSFL